MTQTECGLTACLALLDYHGRFEDLNEIRQEFESGRDGLSFLQLSQLLSSRGMWVRAVRVRDVRALARLDQPLILFWQGYHFVVLERISATRAYLMDPETGRRTISIEELREGFSGLALLSGPGPQFASKRKPVAYEWQQVRWRRLAPARLLASAVLLSCLGYALTMTLPVATAAVIDATLAHRGDNLMTKLWCLLPLAVALFFAVQLIQAIVMSRVVAHIGGELMRNTFWHLLRVPMRFFTTRASGDLMFRLATTGFLRDALSSRILDGLLSAGLAAVLLGYVTVTSPTLGVVTAGLCGLSLVFLVATRSQLSQVMDAEIHHSTRSQAIQQDAVASVAVIKMGGYPLDFYHRWNREYTASLTAMRRRMVWEHGWVGGLTAALQVFSPLVLVLVGVHLFSRSQISLGEAVAVQSLGGLLFSLSGSVVHAYTEIVQCSRYLHRLADITGTPVEREGGSLTRLADSSIDVRDLHFAYTASSPAVLNGVSLSIEAGETVSIVGPSGSGKSTLAKHLCGLYCDDDERILLGGHPLADYDLNRIRTEIGYVPQDVSLHNGTLLDNLRLGNDRCDPDIVDFCRSLGFLGFIDELAMGYQTMVSDLGANFSGGQKQRIAIARALIAEPRILVLDEATSALDTVTEALVMAALGPLACTKVILAHRLATIRGSDRIYVMQAGRIAEVGCHEALLDAGGIYADLYRTGDRIDA